MATINFNATRLDLARRRRGITKRDLASKIGVTPIALTAYSRGEYNPTDETVLKMATELRFPPSFFYGSADFEELPEAATSFRALSKLPAREKHQALAAGAVALALSDWIAHRFTLPQVDIPRYEGLDPEAAAAQVRGDWGLGVQPIGNVIHTLESHGVRVFSLVEETRHLDAFSFWRSETPYVFLNTMKSGERSRMDAAHELGHLVLHWNDEVRGPNAEREAKRFAAAFLMPRESVIAYGPEVLVLTEIVSAKHIWGVSVASLTVRLHELELISDWQYHSLFQQIGRQGYRVSEPEPCDSESSRVLDLVLGTLASEGVMMSQIASDLTVYPDELYNHVFGLTLAPVGKGDASAIEPSRNLNFY